MNNKNKWISASDISSARYCPKSLQFRKQGIKGNGTNANRMAEGRVSHDYQTQNAYRQQARWKKGQQDQRCFVASYALGQDHPVTQQLRDWRDTTLMTRPVGRLFVSIYYRVSPPLIRWCGDNRTVHKLARKGVLTLAGLVKGSSDHG